MKLTQKNIVITGGTSGIGYELVKRLQSDNRVLVIAGNRDRLEGLARDFPGLLTCCADLSQTQDVERAAGDVVGQFGKVDLLINNAALQTCPGFLDTDFDSQSIAREIGVNLTAVCLLTARLLPALLGHRPAAIVNVNSGLALMPKSASAVYCATKAAVNSFSQSLRYQLEQTNVRVMQAFMPLVDTPMTAGRGSGKMTAGDAAAAMLRGIESDVEEHDIGKIATLRLLIRLAPGIARRVMKAA